MLPRLFPIYILCVGVFTTISSEPGIKNFLNFLKGEAVLYLSRNTKEASKDPFDPSYMDAGSFKKENDVLKDKSNCIVENVKSFFVDDCNSSTPYRTYDGSCNNLVVPSWGKVGDSHTRLLQGSYEGVSGIRQSVTGGPLPNPRELVLNIFTDTKQPSRNVSFLFTVFGQFLAHDMTNTDKQSVKGSCCSKNNSMDTSKCAPIFYPPDDPFYSKFNVTCLDFQRSKANSFCLNAKRQQPNSVTATIDGSIIYGNSEKKATSLRTMDGTGMMRGENTSFGQLLPRPDEKDKLPEFCPHGKKQTCFFGGDARINQHSFLMTIQTIFFREHNRIARILHTLNPNWDEETLYQEARKIVGAEFQNIVYSEYLPSLVGPAHMNYYNLWVDRSSSSNQDTSTPSDQSPKGTQYQSIVRLGIWNEFATVFRFGHSMVSTRVGTDDHRFADYYSNPRPLRTGQMDKILLGATQVPSESTDRWFVEDVSCRFSQQKNSLYGKDLVSTDIQRGRDHGIPAYADMLKFLTEGRMDVKNFKDLSPIMSDDNIKLLENSYKDVRDVDLFAGVVMEDLVPGSNLGPTGDSIVSLQFFNVKYGDRFYFEHGNQSPSFTTAQREALKSSSLSSILCLNAGITSIQKNPMLFQSAENPVIDCTKIPSLDLSPWKKTSK